MNDMDTPTTQAHPRRRRWFAGTIALLAVLIIAMGAWRMWRPHAAPTAGPPPVPATTARVASETVPIARTGVGTVMTVASVTVRTRIDGQLDSVEFK